VTASQLLALDLALAALAACAWTATAYFALRTGLSGRPDVARSTSRSTARSTSSIRSTRTWAGIALLCLTAALALLLGRLAILPALVTGSWWFANEKATIGLPVAALPAVLASVMGIPYLARLRSADATGSQQNSAASRLALMGIIVAATGATASILVTLVLGPFPAPWATAVT